MLGVGEGCRESYMERGRGRKVEGRREGHSTQLPSGPSIRRREKEEERIPRKCERRAGKSEAA